MIVRAWVDGEYKDIEIPNNDDLDMGGVENGNQDSTESL